MFRMIELGGKGYYCSQILMFMGLEAQGKENPDLIRAVAGLAGGLGFTGDTCGALSGAACLLGLYAGKGLEDEAEDPRLNKMIGELVEWFSDEYGKLYGGIRCDIILDNNPQSRTTRCPSLVLGAYEKVKVLLLENGFDLSGATNE
jgi:C_GCAxxG_C_C family probable redox protein